MSGQDVPGFYTRIRGQKPAGPVPLEQQSPEDLDAAAERITAARAKLQRREEGIRSKGIQEGRQRQREEDAAALEQVKAALTAQHDADLQRAEHRWMHQTVPAARAHGFWRGAVVGLLLGATTAGSAMVGLANYMIDRVFVAANPSAGLAVEPQDGPLVWDRDTGK